jgi:predicted phosphohydrolase
MIVAIVSDVHRRWHDIVVPPCDLLISAGDYSNQGEPTSVVGFHEWMSHQPATHKISVQGNHELWVEHSFESASAAVKEIDPDIYFTAQQTLHISGHVIHCSAVTPYFCNWAWNVHRGVDIQKHWEIIPDNTDILVTHGPAYGILDEIVPGSGEHLGCQDLLNRVKQLKNLKLHAFGHIHGSSGEELVDGVQFVNASMCDEQYTLVNPVRVVEL